MRQYNSHKVPGEWGNFKWEMDRGGGESRRADEEPAREDGSIIDRASSLLLVTPGWMAHQEARLSKAEM